MPHVILGGGAGAGAEGAAAGGITRIGAPQLESLYTTAPASRVFFGLNAPLAANTFERGELIYGVGRGNFALNANVKTIRFELGVIGIGYDTLAFTSTPQAEGWLMEFWIVRNQATSYYVAARVDIGDNTGTFFSSRTRSGNNFGGAVTQEMDLRITGDSAANLDLAGLWFQIYKYAA